MEDMEEHMLHMYVSEPSIMLLGIFSIHPVKLTVGLTIDIGQVSCSKLDEPNTTYELT